MKNSVISKAKNSCGVCIVYALGLVVNIYKTDIYNIKLFYYYKYDNFICRTDFYI